MAPKQDELLLSLVQGIEGRAWALDRQGWELDSQFDVCLWDGVECDTIDKFTIIGLSLPGADLSATLPSTLGLLSTLREISLPRNILRGSIPPEIAALPHLETLILKQNHLTGTIPPFSSPTLRSVDLSYNQIGGTIPFDIGKRHERMTDFNVMQNRLFGPIPESFEEMTSLNTLTLSENGLSGTIPSGLGNAKVLHFLYLDNNFLMGTIPNELARLNSPMEELWLQHNDLSGTVPAALSDLEELFNFYIDGNKFTGTVPPELCREGLNEDFFEGVADEDIKDRCDSIACSVGQVSFEGVFPCEACDEAYFNPYLGRVGQCIDLDQRDILRILYDNMGGEEWTGMSVKWEKSVDDYCQFSGITCDNNFNVIELNLKGKNLRGQIPEEIGFLRYLETLDLSDNHLSGFLPSDLRWAPLEVLDVSNNQLIGVVPPMLCLKGNINGNGAQGEFNCEHIACPIGTYGIKGIGSHVDGKMCTPCETSLYLASTNCPTTVDEHANYELDVTGAFVLGMFLLISGLIGLLFMAIVEVRGHLARKKGGGDSQQRPNLAYHGVDNDEEHVIT